MSFHSISLCYTPFIEGGITIPDTQLQFGTRKCQTTRYLPHFFYFFCLSLIFILPCFIYKFKMVIPSPKGWVIIYLDVGVDFGVSQKKFPGRLQAKFGMHWG